MQTFVPYIDHYETARALDYRRLGKQRVETFQILKSLYLYLYINKPRGWMRHPAVLMWKGHERALIEYGLVMCEVWKERGYKDTTSKKIENMAQYFPEESSRLPDWWGDESIHKSHRSRLLEKDWEYYTLLFLEDEPSEDYVWPDTQEFSISDKAS